MFAHIVEEHLRITSLNNVIYSDFEGFELHISFNNNWARVGFVNVWVVEKIEKIAHSSISPISTIKIQKLS